MKSGKVSSMYIIFLIGLFLLEISNMYARVIFVKDYLYIMKIFSFMLFMFGAILKLKKRNFRAYHIVLLALLLFISCITYIITKNTIAIEILLISINVIDMDFEKIIKNDFKIKMFITISLIVFSYLGFAKSEFIVFRGNFIRSDFGFYHPNTFGMYIMIIFFEYLFLKRNHFKWYDYLIGFLCSYLIHITSDTRTAIYGIVLSLILFFVFSKRKRLYMKCIYINTYAALLIGTLILTFYFVLDMPFSTELNEILSTRLAIQADYMLNTKLTLFGMDLEYTRTLDNGFIKILLNYGICTTVFFMLYYRKVFNKILENGEISLLCIFLSVLVFSTSESYMFYIYNNIFITYLFTRNKEKGELNNGTNVINNCSYL